jgi:hypothetical protein
MSELHRKLLGNIGGSGLPPKPKSLLSTASQPTASAPNQIRQAGRKRDYSAVSWSLYFDSYRDIITDENNHFRVYVKGNEGPVIFFLHGGNLMSSNMGTRSNLKVVFQFRRI